MVPTASDIRITLPDLYKILQLLWSSKLIDESSCSMILEMISFFWRPYVLVLWVSLGSSKSQRVIIIL
jgi:hypothetical protein